MSSDSDKTPFMNASANGEIPSFNGDAQARATDFANYFCSYAQLYHQKQMLADHNRMAAYHSAILGNQDVFRDKVVMDIGTGSGILAVWAAQAGARKVYAIEYTDMAKHAEQVMKANGVDHIVTVIQGAVEEVVLPVEKDNLEVVESDKEGSQLCVDIIVSEWMGYFLLRESMLDSIIRARDKFLKPATGLMFPSHTTMYLAPVSDEEERKAACNEYASAMSDWQDFQQTTNTVYGVNMSVLEQDFDREQKEYYLLSSRWTELHAEAILADPQIIKEYDMMTCTLEDARGVLESDRNNKSGGPSASFDFDINGDECARPVSGFSGWFTADFKSRTDAGATPETPRLQHPAFLSTGPENGYTHWGQQTFYLVHSAIPTLKGEITRLVGNLEMTRTKRNSRLYNCRITYNCSRRRIDEDKETGAVLMKSGDICNVYQIP
jgi:protein arginine N-methyltransferase 1